MELVESRQYTVKSLLRPMLRRILSPGLFQFVRFRWWSLWSYFPRLITSRLVNARHKSAASVRR